MLKILIVEDCCMEFNYCKSLICELDKECKIYAAVNGEQALSFLYYESIDVIFLDVGLPGCNGFQLADKIRSFSQYHITPLIFITGVKADNHNIFRKYKNYDYIVKPYTENDFKNKIQPLFKSLKANFESKIKKSTVIINTHNVEYVINKNNFLYAEVHNRKLTIYLDNQIIKEVNMNLKKFIDSMNDPYIIQCYKSCAININRVINIVSTSKKTWKAAFYNPDNLKSISCPISASFIKEVREKLISNL